MALLSFGRNLDHSGIFNQKLLLDSPFQSLEMGLVVLCLSPGCYKLLCKPVVFKNLAPKLILQFGNLACQIVYVCLSVYFSTGVLLL